MDRPIIYTEEQGRSVDFLFSVRATMIGLAKLSSACMGGNTSVRGLTVTPNSPAALNVLVGIGEIYSIEEVDATSWGSLPADTSDMILKQGLNMVAQTVSTPAPATSGYSIAYLIEAQYQDQDTNYLVPPFYNSSNPQVPLNGEGGLGGTLPTERQGVCVIQAKAGVAATTGTQVTPTVDSGWTALAVVTVANGQSTVTSGNISIPAGVPQISSLLQMMQTGSSVYAVDTSASANAIALSLTPAVTAYTDGEPIRFKATNNNTGPCTINWGGGSIALNGANGALQGGEIIAGKQYEAQYNSTTGTAILLGQTAGALQIPPATASNHAVQLGQLTQTGIVPGRLLNIQTFTSSGTYTPTAGTTHVRVTVVGGGGGGGGAGATSASQAAAAGGGGSGAVAIGYYANAVTQTVTVGLGGLASGASASNGGTGGTSSFGSIISAAGSSGGVAGAAFTPPGTSGGGGQSATPTLGNIVNSAGAQGGFGQAFGTGNTTGGAGGNGLWGGGAVISNNTVGTSGTGPGAGASGASNFASQAAKSGGTGANGIVIVEEFA